MRLILEVWWYIIFLRSQFYFPAVKVKTIKIFREWIYTYVNILPIFTLISLLFIYTFHIMAGHSQPMDNTWTMDNMHSFCQATTGAALLWRHNGHDGVSNHQPHDCLLNRLFTRRSKKTSKLRVTGLCVGNSPVAGEFPAQMASDAENVSIWWRHHSRTQIEGMPRTASRDYALGQDCGVSVANELEILQSCAKPSTCTYLT